MSWPMVEVVASVLAPGAIWVAKELLAVSTPALAPAAPARPLIQTSPTVTPSPAPCADGLDQLAAAARR